MGKIIASITTSVDGYVTGPDDGPEYGLGKGGERLHYWVMGGPWTYDGGHEFAMHGPDKDFYDELVSTIPIHELLKIWRDAPPAVHETAAKLRYNSLINVVLGVNEDRGYPWTALYVPDPEIVFCPLDPTPLPLSYREEGDRLHYNGDYHERRRVPGADVDVCFGGRIAVTRIALL